MKSGVVRGRDAGNAVLIRGKMVNSSALLRHFINVVLLNGLCSEYIIRVAVWVSVKSNTGHESNLD